MYTFKRYKQIHTTVTFKQYVWRHVLYKPRRWIRIPYCTYMCLRYPFLYARNRFTGLHYNNWKIRSFCNELNKQYHKWCFHDIPPRNAWYVRGNVGFENYWTNWWAKPLHDLIRFYHNSVLQFIHCLPTSTEWDSVEKGWNKAFGKQYLEDLRHQLKQEGSLYSFRIMDIKEKWGRFQLYPAMASKAVYNIIGRYEDLSWHTCIHCGQLDTYVTTGWILPYCADCVDKFQLSATLKGENHED